MILAPTPEACDRETLLSGPEGRVLDAFLKAARLPDDQIYRASALPCHSPGADWNPRTNSLIAEALNRHIHLVRPQRLLVLGFVILPLLGHDSPQGPAVSLELNHEDGTIPMLAVRRLPAAASQPRWKSALWHAWLDWSA
jgi:uracil-DNA glycosylase